jgi:hypothetical protein
MSNLTLSVDDKSTERARVAAQKMGLSLNQFLRDQIDRLAGYDQRKAEHDAYEARCRAGGGRLNGWKFDREEANQRG